MNKIFFSDLDGTLLTSDKHISPLTMEAIDGWLKDGNYLALSSGRPLLSIKEVIAQNNLNKPGVYAISFNGAQIYDVAGDKIISSKTLDLDLVKKISHMAMENKVYCHTYNDTHILTPHIGREIELYTRTIHLPVLEIKDFPDSLTTRPCKMLCIDTDPDNRLADFGKVLNEAFPGQLSCLKSNPFLLEVFPISSGKGNAVEDLCNILNVDIKNTLAAGDEQNDLSMLQRAGLGIAMKNGNEQLKLKADTVTEKDNDHDGLVPFLTK